MGFLSTKWKEQTYTLFGGYFSLKAASHASLSSSFLSVARRAQGTDMFVGVVDVLHKKFLKKPSIFLNSCGNQQRHLLYLSSFFFKVFSRHRHLYLTVDRQEMGERGGCDMQSKVLWQGFAPGSAAYVACALNHSTICAPNN